MMVGDDLSDIFLSRTDTGIKFGSSMDISGPHRYPMSNTVAAAD
jgi:hypothetical protein